jgi:hypothetical protein
MTVQLQTNEATILTLVAQGMGVGFVVETARWRCPEGVAILKVGTQKPERARLKRPSGS